MTILLQKQLYRRFIISNAPYLVNETRWGARMNDIKMKDAMVLDGLWCPENNVHMLG
ncbi:hypothetical protein H6C13_20105 [Pseudoflavonifractor phocaeensis]|nr:hypothetical protein [Pseudoflavonifractor phocaeensis]